MAETVPPAASTRQRSRGVGALLVCLAIVAVLVAIRPDPAEDARRAWVTVPIGMAASTRNAEIEVSRVQLTRSLLRYDRPIGTDETFVLVTWSGAARTTRDLFGRVTLRTRDGSTYDPRPEFISAAPGSTQPGFTSRGTSVFEVATDRLGGAHFVVDGGGGEFDVYDRAVRVDLGLTEHTPVENQLAELPVATIEVTR